jgi:hypothetical protein
VEATTASWHFWFGLLEVFVEENGHARVHQHFKTDEGFTLGNWVSAQRVNKDKLSTEKITQLESLPGWTWAALNTRWDEGFGHLKAFTEREGHARPPSKFKTPDGYELGIWVSTQRYVKDKMSHERIAKLEALPGWTWDSFDAQWDEGIGRLEAFIEEEGHAMVPSRYVTSDGFPLGKWVSHRRAERGKLSKSKITKLGALPGWVWDILKFQWEQGFEHLQAFVKQEQSSRVSNRYVTSDGYKLGSWVSVQRRNRERLSGEQRARLESLPGWAWDLSNALWEEGFRHLDAFAKQKGHVRVALRYKTADGYALGNWVSKQRAAKDSLSPEQIFKLEALPGWVWDVLRARWEEGFSHLLAFCKHVGHAGVRHTYKNADGYALGVWVGAQRRNRGKLTLKQIAKLESLPGWVWAVHEIQWEEGFGYLEAFAQSEGHARVSGRFKTPDGYALGAWVGAQRGKKEKLTPEQMTKLEALPGWVWNALEARWEESFAHLQAFVQQERHSRVPQKYKAPDGFPLGQWVGTQRYTKDKLSPERITRLEVLPGWIWKAG